MGKRDERVDAYMLKVAEFARPILEHLRELVHATCPDVEETWKWSFPVFMYKGAVMCNMAGFKEHCVFGFWKAALLADPDNILSVQDRQSMGHLGKLVTLKDLPKDAVLKKYIKAAMKLNEDGIKAPSKPKATATEKAALVAPGYLAAALAEHPKAQAAFDVFSYSHRKEYIQWLEEAKTDATRNKRLAQAIAMLEEGKSRNWKYSDC